MKIFFTVLLASITLFAFQNEKGKIDMHGGKSQNYGGFSKKIQDSNSTNLKKFQ